MTRPICRICFDEDLENDFIIPCKCSGTAKYVHKECLNEWRTTSTNRLAFTECFECKYKYIIVNNNQSDRNCENCQKITQLIGTFVLLSSFIISLFIGLLSVVNISERQLIINNQTSISNIIASNYIIYCVLFYSTIVYLIIICTILNIKNNKWNYIKYYFRQKALLFVVVLSYGFGIVLLYKLLSFDQYTELFEELLGIVFIIISSQVTLKLHIGALAYIRSTQVNINTNLEIEEYVGSESSQNIEIVT